MHILSSAHDFVLFPKKKKKKKEIDQPVGIDWYTSICYKGVAVHDDDESDDNESKRVGLPW